MPINLISKLESISGYRQFFMADHPRYAENPIAYSHQIFHLGGRPTSILSRIGPYGIDYTGRASNKIAHHLVVEPHEMSPAGPAWLLQQSVIRSEWHGHCETPSTGPSIPMRNQDERICTEWKNVAGDAGWAGVVAETITQSDETPLWIVYSLAQRDRLLAMMDEVIALLPVAQRWQATFNTFAVKIPPDGNCRIRFVPEGTDEAKQALSGKRCINLTKPAPVARTTRWIERARGMQRPVASVIPTRSIETSSEAVADTQSDLASYWDEGSSVEEAENSPPPTGPPDLPGGLNRKKRKSPAWWTTTGIFLFAALAAIVWFAASQFSDPPIPQRIKTPVAEEPSEAPETIADSSEPSETQTPSSPATETIEFRLRYDKKQLMGWVLGRNAGEGLSEKTPFPREIEVRGGLKLADLSTAQLAPKSDSENETPAQESFQKPTEERQVVFAAWGADPFSLADPKNYDVVPTELVDGKRSLAVRQLRQVPMTLPRAQFFWHPETGYLIGDVKLDFNAADSTWSGQSGAYREFAMSLTKLLDSVKAIKEQSETLPPLLQNLVAPFLVRLGRSQESLASYLFRTIPFSEDFEDDAGELRQRLQNKVLQLPQPLSRIEQSAVLNIVAICGEIPLLANDMRKAQEVLKTGHEVEVPELIFFDADRAVIRRVPLSIYFSW